jgi:hypothetical protein
LRKAGIERLKDGSIAANPQRMGPLTFEARLMALDRILEIQRSCNLVAVAEGLPLVDILNPEEEARIRELIAAKTWPNGWAGDEPTADVLAGQHLCRWQRAAAPQFWSADMTVHHLTREEGRQLFSQKKAKRGNKFNAERVLYDGHMFDSKAERDYYAALKLRERVGEITELELQREYHLMVNGVLVTRYKADMVFHDRIPGRRRVVDVKGRTDHACISSQAEADEGVLRH